jgi:hypothetical protein
MNLFSIDDLQINRIGCRRVVEGAGDIAKPWGVSNAAEICNFNAMTWSHTYEHNMTKYVMRANVEVPD